jgi:hypothetical protein
MPQILKRIKNQGARIKQRTLHTDKRGRIQIITDRAYSVTSPWRACGSGKEVKERAIKNRFTKRHKEVTKVHRERFFISRGKEGKERAIKNRFTEKDFLYLAGKKGKKEQSRTGSQRKTFYISRERRERLNGFLYLQKINIEQRNIT